MRKAFEKNVALRRPQLRRAAAVEGLAPGAAQPVALVSRPAAPPPPSQAATDADVRHERLEKIKRVVAELTAPVPRVELEKIRRRVIRPAPPAGPLPSVPARDAVSVLSRVEALGAELARTRQREEALRGELDAARGDRARSAGEARASNERLAAAYADYLLQVAVRQRAAAEREAKQPGLECALEQGAREGAEASTPAPRQAGYAAIPAYAAMPMAVQRRTQRTSGSETSRDALSESPSRGRDLGHIDPHERGRGFHLRTSRWRRSPALATPIRIVGKSDNRSAASIVTANEARTAVALVLTPRLRSQT